MKAPIVERTFEGDPESLLPPVTFDNAPFWQGLEAGQLSLQRCRSCNRMRFPVAPVCPYCGSTKSAWVEASGQGRVFSHVRYQRNYLPEFESLMPYVVACVELDEGPRMFGLIRDTHDPPAIGDPVSMMIERWPNGRCVVAFRIDGARL